MSTGKNKKNTKTEPVASPTPSVQINNNIPTIMSGGVQLTVDKKNNLATISVLQSLPMTKNIELYEAFRFSVLIETLKKVIDIACKSTNYYPIALKGKKNKKNTKTEPVASPTPSVQINNNIPTIMSGGVQLAVDKKNNLATISVLQYLPMTKNIEHYEAFRFSVFNETLKSAVNIFCKLADYYPIAPQVKEAKK